MNAHERGKTYKCIKKSIKSLLSTEYFNTFYILIIDKTFYFQNIFVSQTQI